MKFSRRALTVLLGVALSAGLAVPAVIHGQTNTAPAIATSSISRTFTPFADAYVTKKYPNRNYGTALILRTDTSPVYRSYLRFSVQGLTGTIQSVKLRVYAKTASSVGYDVRAVANNSWGERTIAYNTAPPVGSIVNTSGAFRKASWTAVDVTSLVSGNGSWSFALTGRDATLSSFASRESGATAAQLVITTEATPTPSATRSSTPSASQTATATPSATLSSVPSPPRTRPLPFSLLRLCRPRSFIPGIHKLGRKVASPPTRITRPLWDCIVRATMRSPINNSVWPCRRTSRPSFRRGGVRAIIPTPPFRISSVGVSAPIRLTPTCAGRLL